MHGQSAEYTAHCRQVTKVYTVILGENQANISTLQMLASLESHIEDMFEYMEMVPPDRLHAAEKVTPSAECTNDSVTAGLCVVDAYI